MNLDFLVSVETEERIIGTGFFVASDIIITAAHVIGTIPENNVVFKNGNNIFSIISKLLVYDDWDIVAYSVTNTDQSGGRVPFQIAEIGTMRLNGRINVFSYSFCDATSSPRHYEGFISGHYEEEKKASIHLENANMIAPGASGAPIIHRDCILGIITCFPDPTHGRQMSAAHGASISKFINALGERIKNPKVRASKTINFEDETDYDERIDVVTKLRPKAVSKNYDEMGREFETFLVTNEIKNTDIVLLYGIGGIGKTELCRKLFERWSSKVNLSDDGLKLSSIGWLFYNGSIEQTCYNNFPVIEPTSDMKAYLDNVKALTRKHGRKLLLFIDNINDIKNVEHELRDFGCRLIITSRSNQTQYIASMVEINMLRPDFCYTLYRKFIETDEQIEQNVPAQEVIDIANLCNFHTLTLELLAKTQRSINKTYREMLKLLLNQRFDLRNIDETVYYVHNPENGQQQQSKAPFNSQLGKIFAISNLPTNQVNLLKLLSVFSDEPIAIDLVSKWVGIDSYVILNELIEKGWVNQNYANSDIQIHSVISSMIISKYEPKYHSYRSIIYNISLSIEDHEKNHKMTFPVYTSHAISVSRNVDGNDLVFAKFAYYIAKLYELFSDDVETERWKLRALSIAEREYMRYLRLDRITSIQKLKNKYYKNRKLELTILRDIYRKLARERTYKLSEPNPAYFQHKDDVLTMKIGDSKMDVGILEKMINMYDQSNRQKDEIVSIFKTDRDSVQKMLRDNARILNSNTFDDDYYDHDTKTIHFKSKMNQLRYIDIGWYISTQKYKKAISELRKLIRYAENVESLKKEAIRKLYLEIADTLAEYDKAEESITFYTKALALTADHNDYREIIYKLVAKCRENSNPELCIKYLSDMLNFDIARKSTERVIVEDYLNMAIEYERQKKDGSAFDLYNAALKLTEKPEDHAQHNYITRRIACIYSRQGNIEMAKDLYEQSKVG